MLVTVVAMLLPQYRQRYDQRPRHQGGPGGRARQRAELIRREGEQAAEGGSGGGAGGGSAPNQGNE